MSKSIPLKEIVGFLPYELNVKTNNLIRKMVIETSDLVYVHQLTRDKQVSISNVINGIGHKPIVRPLSNLTKEITHNGETFVPILNLCQYPSNIELLSMGYEKKKYYASFGYKDEIIRHEIPSDLGSMDYFTVESLTAWHFDIYDWIKDGLAIDINTL